MAGPASQFLFFERIFALFYGGIGYGIVHSWRYSRIPAEVQPKNIVLGKHQNNVLKKGTYLYMETEALLNDEFRKLRNYKLIFRAIALGSNPLGEICNNTGLDKSMVSKYLDVLKSLHIIKEEIPVTASRKFKKRSI